MNMASYTGQVATIHRQFNAALPSQDRQF